MKMKNTKFIKNELRNDPFEGVISVYKIYDYEVDSGFWEVGTDLIEEVKYKRNSEEYFIILKNLATKYEVKI